jgi:hypothetical protein
MGKTRQITLIEMIDVIVKRRENKYSKKLYDFG